MKYNCKYSQFILTAQLWLIYSVTVVLQMHFSHVYLLICRTFAATCVSDSSENNKCKISHGSYEVQRWRFSKFMVPQGLCWNRCHFTALIGVLSGKTTVYIVTPTHFDHSLAWIVLLSCFYRLSSAAAAGTPRSSLLVSFTSLKDNVVVASAARRAACEIVVWYIQRCTKN